ncbi:PAS domain S-box protein [Flavobacterium sp. XS2P39]|uniref:PAS domain S-box protein n=1 Tax=Flavobacterium sp. XS2P39 TaxID=3401725 RepID=UPI003AABCFDD
MKTKILIVENTFTTISSIQDELKKGNIRYVVEIVQSEKKFENSLLNFKPDIILSNYTLPFFDGRIAFEIKQKLAPQTPFIFISKTIGEENTIELIKNGVTDFVLKERLFTLTNKVNRALKEASINKLITKFKQSEENYLKELGQNEAKFRSLFENTIDAVLLTVTDGEILAANPAACNIFKMTEKEIIGAGRSGLIDATDSELKILLDELQLTGRTAGKLPFVRKDGSRFPGKFTLAIFKNASGEERTSMIIRDVSERKKAEQALKASEAFSTGILDSLTSHIVVINSEGTILKVNKAWDTFAQNNHGTSGKKYGEGANYFDACKSQNNSADDHASKALKGIKDVLNGTINGFHLEYPCHSPTHERWFIMRVNKFGSSENMVLIEHHDISERKIAEQKLSATTKALQKSLNDNNKILNSSLDIICSFDEEGRFVNVSAASERIWGHKPNELIGKKYMDFIFHEDARNSIDVDLAIRNGVPVTMYENRYIHKNGSLVPLLWSARYDDPDKLMYCVAKDATEKKSFEKAFEIEKQRFYDLYSQAPSCMGILKGPAHTYELTNQLYLQLIGKKDIIGKTVKEVLPELEAQGIFEFLDIVYKTGETFSANEMLVKFDLHGNGILVDTYLNFMYQAHRNMDGNIDGIFFFANNVTEQVLSRKKIEESEKRYWELIQNLPVATYYCDAEGRIMIYNKAATVLWGREPEIEKNLWCGSWNLYDKNNNSIPLELCPMAIVLKGGREIVRDEIIIERPNGDKRNVVPYPVPFIDAAGRITGAVNVLTDITENKTAQQALKISEKKYRYLFENNPIPMWIIDVITLKFLDVNQMAILQYGYTFEEFLSMTALDIRPEADKERFIQSLDASEINSTNYNRGIWNHRKKDGTIIPVEIIAHEIIYGGSMARFILSNDITDRQKIELNLEQQNKKLVKINAELDRFAYSVSHDLRSPLTSVLGLLSFIEEESQEADTLEHAEMIRTSINRLDEFIKNILNYARNNRIRLEVKKIPIQQTAIAIVDSLRSMKEAKGIIFEIDIKEKKSFYSDSLRVNTIMENLISNAIKYHKKSGSGRFIKITGQSDHEKLQLSIADNGTGIAAVYHTKIFDMFFRLSGKTNGSGIGLYIVKETVEKLKGSIQVESEVGTGTTFIITLKRLKPWK